jgi:hypothetical protein
MTIHHKIMAKKNSLMLCKVFFFSLLFWRLCHVIFNKPRQPHH